MQKGVLLLMWGLFFCIASLFSATATRRAAAVGNEKKNPIGIHQKSSPFQQSYQLTCSFFAKNCYPLRPLGIYLDIAQK